MDVHYILHGQAFEWNAAKAAANLRKHRVSFEKACEVKGNTMNMNKRVRKRLRKERPMSTISIRVPEDVIDDLKRIAPVLGFSGYQPLLRAYVGQGLRRDLAKLENDQVGLIVESLRRRGVDDDIISEAVAEAKARTG